MTTPHEARIALPPPASPELTLRFTRVGPRDPTARQDGARHWHACRTPDGPATLCLERVAADAVRGRAWGPGAAWLLDRAPALLGVDDAPAALVPRDRVVRGLRERQPGLRLSRCPRLVDAMVPIVLQQRVTFREAASAWRALVRRHGEPAPGPCPGLHVAPAPEVLARLPPTAFEPLGVERRRADTIRRIATLARRVEPLRDAPADAAARALGAIPGVGPWTVGMTLGLALGHPDAVIPGDVHLPNAVAWALAREPRGDDARMLALLAPYAGQRFRVVRLLLGAGVAPPRRGPRFAPRTDHRWTLR